MENNPFLKIRKEYYTHKKDSISKKLKESIFGVIFVLLKDEESFELLDSFLFIFEFLEFMIFPFNPEVKGVWQNDKITDTVSTIFSYFSFLTYISGNSSLYLAGLYTSLLLITLVLINIGYVSYSFSRKYFTATWPLYLLRTVAKIFVTGLFMPLFELNLSIFYCVQDDNGNWVNDSVNDIKCYTPAHFVHMFITLIVTFIFLVISLFVGLTFFENSEIAGGDSAKENSRADFAIMISKIVSTFSSVFFVEENYQWYLVVVNFVFSVFQFTKMYVDRPYYNFKQMGLVMCLNGVYMWSNFMLLMCKIFSSYQFEGGFYIWLIGCPIIGFCFYCGSNDSNRVLSKGINLCKTSDEVQRHLRYFLTISEHISQRDENNMTLQGYIFNHTCHDAQCPLCELKRQENFNQGNSINSLSSGNHNIKKYLFEYVENIYTKEISKYPNSTSLRIAYAMFLYDRKNDKALALQQLTFAEKYNPLLDEEFIIYRYTKMINEENERLYHANNINGEEVEEEEELDVVSSIAYDSHFRLCLHNIKKSSELYINFWEKIINSSSQDLGQLNEMAVNINAANKNIEIHWKNMLELKPNDPKAFKIYGGFVKNVLNNKDKGNELMAIGYETSDKKPNSVGYLSFEIDEEYVHLSKEGNSFIFCSMEDEKVFGNIIKCSKTTMKYFGFNEKEIMSNKNIKNLFLDCYNKSILNFIKEELEKSIDTLIQCNQYLMFIKHKSNKPQPTFVIFRKYKGNYMKEKCFVAIFMSGLENRENIKTFIKNVYYIVDQDLKVKYITQGGIELLSKLGRKLPDDYGNLGKLYPEFEFENEDDEEEELNGRKKLNSLDQYVILNKSIGCKVKSELLDGYQSEENSLYLIKLQVIPRDKRYQAQKKEIKIKPTFVYPKISLLMKYNEIKNSDNNSVNDNKDLPNNLLNMQIHNTNIAETKINFNYNRISFYEFSNVKKPKNLNWLLYLDDEEDSSEQSSSGSDNNEHSKLSLKNPSKEKSDKEDYDEEIKDNVLPLSKKEQTESEFLMRNKQLFESLSSDEFRKKLETLRNYSAKVNYYVIKIKKNEIEKIEHFQQKVIDVIRDKKHTLTVTDSMQLNRNGDYSKFQSSSFSQKSKVYSKVQNLGYLSGLVLVLFLLYSFIEYYLDNQAITDKKNNFSMISISFDSIVFFQLCHMFLRNLVLSNEVDYQYYHNETFIADSIENLNKYTNQLSEIHFNITLYSNGLSKKHKQLFENKTVPFFEVFHNNNWTKVNYTFLHSFEMQISLILAILPIQIDTILFNNTYIEQYMYNNLNEFFVAGICSLNFFYELIKSNVNRDIIEDCCLCVVNLIISILMIVFLYKKIIFIEFEKTKMLKSFYKIPKFYLKNLSNKSKIFIQKIEKYIANTEDEENQNKSEEDYENSSSNGELNEKDELMIKKGGSMGDSSYIGAWAMNSKSSLSKGNNYLPRAVFIIIFILTYFLVSFIINTISSIRTKALNTNFYYNSFYFVNATSLYNIVIEKILNKSKIIFLSEKFDVINTTFNDFSKLQNDIIESNSDCYEILSKKIINLLNSIQSGDICLISEVKEQIENCDSKLNYISNFGSDIILAGFLENLRYIVDILYMENDTIRGIGRLSDERFNVLNILIRDYLRSYLGVYKKNLKNFIINFYNKQSSINAILLIVFEIIIFCGFLFFWIPFLFSLKETVRVFIL